MVQNIEYYPAQDLLRSKAFLQPINNIFNTDIIHIFLKG